MAKSAGLLRVAIAVDGADIERAIAAWELAGVHNSSVEYLLDKPTEEPWPGHDNRTERAEVAAYLKADHWRGIEAAVRASASTLLMGEQLFHVKQLPDRDWRTAWHEHFDIVRIPGDPKIIVRPPHIHYDARPGDVVIDLAPGLAFGTGQHQSTRLCLGLLRDQGASGRRVLDVGTGSGILAVAAAKLGADAVTATDIDPLALDAARETLRRNQVGARVELREGSVPAGEQFDLVIANLTADLLQYLAAELAGALKPDGALIASGLIAARQGEVETAFIEHGLQLQTARSEDDWRALLLA